MALNIISEDTPVVERTRHLLSQFNDNDDLEDVECFLEEEDLMASSFGCRKNPGHRNMVGMAELCLDTLPKRLKDETVLETIRTASRLVARIVVAYISPNRPETDPFAKFAGLSVLRTASGYVRQVSKAEKSPELMCPISKCGAHDEPEKESIFGEIEIVTNKHVVFDTLEAEATRVELFYDYSKTSSVVTLQGMSLRNCSDFLDVSHLICGTHDWKLLELLQSHKNKFQKSMSKIPRYITGCGMSVAISHPHGQPKMVSFGDFIDKQTEEIKMTEAIWNWREGEGRSRGTIYRSKYEQAFGNDSRNGTDKDEFSGTHPFDQDCENKRIPFHVLDTDICLESNITKNRKKKNRDKKREKSLLSPKGTSTKKDNENTRTVRRHVYFYTNPTCKGSSGGPILLELGGCTEQALCLVHSRYDRRRQLNVSLRKNRF